MRNQTDFDFAQLSGHDDLVYRFSLRLGDPDANDWTSDLVLGRAPLLQGDQRVPASLRDSGT